MVIAEYLAVARLVARPPERRERLQDGDEAVVLRVRDAGVREPRHDPTTCMSQQCPVVEQVDAAHHRGFNRIDRVGSVYGQDAVYLSKS